ncbi:MAG UNVERIFIED_CONTAM: carbon-nitrogen hydrolase family protein [Anaerolineae bacterium]|jgi:predicted amidohydrolase
MPHTLRVATIQLNATPASTDERLNRAAQYIQQAAQEGAKLVLLPELFNTGYTYSAANFQRAEPLNGTTVTWMQAQAQQHNIHLAGSLLLLDEEDIYNSLILVSPDGRRWRYDKNYPFLFERAYFRDGSHDLIAQTELGKIGMMICWDHAHPELWKRYAGKVDLMIIASSPLSKTSSICFSRMVVAWIHAHLARSTMPIMAKDEPFGAELDAQAGWLNVPILHSSASGKLRSGFPPHSHWVVMAYLLFRVDLWRWIFASSQLQVEKSFFDKQTKIVNNGGDVVARLTEAEGVVVADVELSSQTPLPLRWCNRNFRIFRDLSGGGYFGACHDGTRLPRGRS